MMLKLPRYKKKCEWGSTAYLRAFFCRRLAILAIARRVAVKMARLLVAMLAGKRGYPTRMASLITPFCRTQQM